MSIVDRDYRAPDDDYEARVSTGLCVICREDQALPDDDLCPSCLVECGVFEVVDVSEENE